MTGLNLESFLHLLRADFGAWATLGLIAVVLALMAWTSWGSRRALRKCLVLSVIAHFGLAFFGGTMPVVILAISPDEEASHHERIRQIKVVPATATETAGLAESVRGGGGEVSRWDRPLGGLALADVKLSAPRTAPASEAVVGPGDRAELKIAADSPETDAPALSNPESRPAGPPPTEATPPPPRASLVHEDEIAPAVVTAARGPSEPAPSGLSNARLRPDRARPGRTAELSPSGRPAGLANLPEAPGPPPDGSDADRSSTPLAERPGRLASVGGEATGAEPGAGAGAGAARPEAGEAAPEVVKQAVSPLPRVALPDVDVRRRSRPSIAPSVAPDRNRPRAFATAPLALARVTPSGAPALPEIRGATGGRPLSDVPEVYRSRLDPNRSARAYRSGASPASEQAVERALDWLSRHQDTDGRWDGATARYDDGTAVKDDDDFTVHCKPGETCFGECLYWEADTALTGLALLAYLGAGYTQTDGKYAATVEKGLDFLVASQKPDGDLRGKSRAVGMYCHAMATIALCEAYALTGDERLRDPVERAVGFLVRSRAKDGLAWRYAPGAPVGDTSILGWVVMALKSAREVGIPIAGSIQAGTLAWLSKVASGDAQGLARYQPWDNVTPTMTAEAWVCRQFLGVGGPGDASTEAANYLLAHGPRSDTYNLYYWYYGTLAMYQNGGDAWYRWNAQVRDEITRRQVVRGHAAGSWAPDDSPYGAKGGRIYCTALATLSLEVYYRYLRLYDEPRIPPTIAPRPRRGDRDPAFDRLGTSPSGRAR